MPPKKASDKPQGKQIAPGIYAVNKTKRVGKTVAPGVVVVKNKKDREALERQRRLMAMYHPSNAPNTERGRKYLRELERKKAASKKAAPKKAASNLQHHDSDVDEDELLENVNEYLAEYGYETSSIRPSRDYSDAEVKKQLSKGVRGLAAKKASASKPKRGSNCKGLEYTKCTKTEGCQSVTINGKHQCRPKREGKGQGNKCKNEKFNKMSMDELKKYAKDNNYKRGYSQMRKPELCAYLDNPNNKKH